MVRLQSSEGQTFEVSKEVAEMSILIKNILEDTDDTDESPIPLPNVTSATLEKVVEFCQQNVVVKDANVDESLLLNVDEDMLFNLILAGNYLDVKSLLDAGCKRVAHLLKGKTPEQIRAMFGIENDFTEEEQEQIRKENAWYLD